MAATKVEDLLDTTCATSSANVKFTANSFDYEAYLYKTDDTAPADFYESGSCGVANANRCALTYAPTAGESVKKLYYWTGSGPELEDGTYGVVEDSNSSPCGTINYQDCIAAADPGQYQEFEIVANYDDCIEEATTTLLSMIQANFIEQCQVQSIEVGGVATTTRVCYDSSSAWISLLLMVGVFFYSLRQGFKIAHT